MLKALRELVSATLLVEFNVMQLTIALKEHTSSMKMINLREITLRDGTREKEKIVCLHVGDLSSSPSNIEDSCKHAV